MKLQNCRLPNLNRKPPRLPATTRLAPRIIAASTHRTVPTSHMTARAVSVGSRRFISDWADVVIYASPSCLSQKALIALSDGIDTFHLGDPSASIEEAHMKQPSERPRPDVWASNGADVERLAKSVEEDGLPYSMAMGELLRSLFDLSETLSRHRRPGS